MTAAFGGLSKAPSTVPEITVREEHSNDEVSIAIERVVIADSVDEALGSAPGDKAMIVVFTATNRWNRPLRVPTDLDRRVSVSAGGGPASPSGTDLMLDAQDSPTLMRIDDLALPKFLQHGVPVTLAYTWNINPEVAHQIAAADEVTVTIYDRAATIGEYTFEGTAWGPPTEGARVLVQPEVRGSVTLAEFVEPTPIDNTVSGGSATGGTKR